MATAAQGVSTLTGLTTYSQSDVDAHVAGVCPHCGVAAQLLKVATGPSTIWLRCTNCLRGLLSERGVLYPGARPLTTPDGLPDDVLRIWDEAMACLSVSAYSSAVMNCRKLLLNIAVSHGLPPKDAKDRAPNFYEAIEHLQGEEIITKRMRTWVDRIKDIGNVANHELQPVSESDAMDVATFTRQLLHLAFELDHMQAQAAAGQV
jgi:hypothetical protein